MSAAQVVEISAVELEMLRNIAAKAKAREVPFALKIGEKGGISLTGHGQRFPTTLYVDQWEYVLDHAPQIRAFIEANRSRLKPGK